jgi:hypothetical protein
MPAEGGERPGLERRRAPTDCQQPLQPLSAFGQRPPLPRQRAESERQLEPDFGILAILCPTERRSQVVGFGLEHRQEWH